MNESELRKIRCCFSGHRPEKIRYNEAKIHAALWNEIISAYTAGFRTYISGMARGVDIWSAELIILFRKSHSDIHLICAPPYPDFETRWSTDWQKRYHSILDQADFIRIVSPHFSWGCYQTRNEWMVDHSSRLIAVYSGQSGGTKNTIEYAQRKQLDIRIIKI